MEEPAGEGAEDDSDLGRERKVRRHADEDAECEPGDQPDPDCGSGAHGAHPIATLRRACRLPPADGQGDEVPAE